MGYVEIEKSSNVLSDFFSVRVIFGFLLRYGIVVSLYYEEWVY